MINAEHLLAFLKGEAEERLSAQKPTDGPLTDAEDIGYLEALEVVSLYVQRAGEKAA